MRKKRKKKRMQAGYDLRVARRIKRRQWEIAYEENRQHHTVHIIGIDKGEIFVVYN